MSFTRILEKIAADISALKLHPTTSEDYDAGYIGARNDAFSIVQEAIDSLPYGPEPDLLVASKGLKRIVEEIDGTMNHGTWRDDHGRRLKDTPEWVAFYVSISGAQEPK